MLLKPRQFLHGRENISILLPHTYIIHHGSWNTDSTVTGWMLSLTLWIATEKASDCLLSDDKWIPYYGRPAVAPVCRKCWGEAGKCKIWISYFANGLNSGFFHVLIMSIKSVCHTFNTKLSNYDIEIFKGKAQLQQVRCPKLSILFCLKKLHIITNMKVAWCFSHFKIGKA